MDELQQVIGGQRTWWVAVGHALTGLRSLPAGIVQTVCTSPPYFGLRSYLPPGHPDKALEIGSEKTPAEFVAKLVELFAEVWRVLRDDGTLWLNIGDSYATDPKGPGGVGTSNLAGGGEYQHIKTEPGFHKWDYRDSGFKRKDMLGVPHMLAFALRDWGWYWRDTIIWAKPNAMPGSQDDRCTSSFEYVFQFSKSARYFSDFEAIKTPPRESSMVRLAQDVQSQAGSHRANGGAKTNGTMKAVGTDKQRGHSRQHAGFNGRWDAMEKAEQQAAPATMRNVWFISTASYSEAHFAVMPDELARRCITAGTSEKGCCSVCGAPVQRVTKSNRVRTRPGSDAKDDASGMANKDKGRHINVTETIGWKDGCKCNSPKVGCLAMDPFNGAGTTGVVACRLGCRYIGFELNPDYANMTRKRILEDQPLLNAV